MNTSIKLLITIVLLLAVNNVQAQSHTFATGWCKLAKSGGVKGESARLECQACNAKDKKEKAAITAENKRRDDAIVAKAKAENDARQATFKEEQRLKQEQDKKERAEKVVIDLSKTNNAKIVTPENKSEENKFKKNYFYSYGVFRRYLYNLSEMIKYSNTAKNYFIFNNDSIFKNNEFLRCFAISADDKEIFYQYNFPPNIGIVILNKVKTISDKNYPISDLVNEKGQRILNNDEVTAIIHFADDYFILLKGGYYEYHNGYGTLGWDFDDASIYNIKTKISHPIQKNKNNQVSLSNQTNWTKAPNHGVRDNDLFSKETYKSFFLTQIEWGGNYIIYYITKEGIIKEQKIIY